MSNNITLKIDGMTCGHCVASVTEELNEVPGVSNVEVFLSARRHLNRHPHHQRTAGELEFSKQRSRRPATRWFPWTPKHPPLARGRGPAQRRARREA